MGVNLVWGLGITGISVVRYLHSIGLEVKIFADNAEPELMQSAIDLIGAENILSHWPERDDFSKIQSVVVSPGVSCWNDRYQYLQRIGMDIKTDIELFLELYQGKVIAVTGTNGKSTLVAKLAHIACQLGVDAVVAGNIGVPCLDVDMSTEMVFLELSSYHLAHGINNNIDLGIILEVTQDHMFWHKSMAHYVFSKHKLHQYADVCFMQKSGIIIDSCGKNLGPSSDLLTLISQYLAWPTALVKEHEASFQPLPHRQQVKYALDRVWVNDSKATNADATMYAISKFCRDDIVLILAGQSKGWQKNFIHPSVKVIILIGSFADWSIMSGDYSRIEVTNLVDAIDQAILLSKAHDVILFSPGGASFDQYKNFAERGERFMEQILCLG